MNPGSQYIPMFIKPDGFLQEAVVDWLTLVAGLDEKAIRATRFRRVNFLPYDARTIYKTVSYFNPELPGSPTRNYSFSNWLNLIAHELFHRHEIGNNLISALGFGISYGWHWVKNRITGKDPYFDNVHEIRAFRVGCDHDSLVNQFLKAFPDTEHWFLLEKEERHKKFIQAAAVFKHEGLSPF